MNSHDDAIKSRTTQPAATLVVFRHNPAGGAPQILLVERSGTMVFAGGATVFPGGKVDRADYELARMLLQEGEPDDVAARIAAIRETLEETGLVVGVKESVTHETAAEARRALISTGRLDAVLADLGWTLDLQALVPFARWVPRHRVHRVYDTRFYLADLGTGAVDLVADATENRHLFWASAAEALDLAATGQIKVIFPTRRNLERLAQWSDFESARAHALATPIVTIAPQIVERDGRRWLTIPEDAGYPILDEPLDTTSRG